MIHLLKERSTRNMAESATEKKIVNLDVTSDTEDSDVELATKDVDVKHNWADLYAKPKSCCLTSDIPCLIDWFSTYPEVEDAKTCARYTELFESAYPTYVKYNVKLAEVYQEFARFQKIYDYAEFEDKIKAAQRLQQLHDKYDSDAEFYKLRKEHLTHHLKLEALRRRIEEWNEKQ
ncbi:unnamed protein product [Bursaphelenchus okinawaensis]|uniref:OCEL domain-containing protein n=1 Tax=Bursaphelenchus okinawaensis TaxID=465554 RepID=A0A811K1S7_9BILA|nr:unnamed protein product [Bursaphelenchus okinawaensis]CAG9089998.1 unnamed protein product [Bursaphelenchus okinawaensis]